MGKSDRADLVAAMRDKSGVVRRHAIRVAELRFPGAALPLELASEWSVRPDDDPLVRLQLACAMATVHHPDRHELMADLVLSAEGRPGEDLIREAVVAFVGADAMRLVRALENGSGVEAHVSLAHVIGRRSQRAEVSELISRALHMRGGELPLRMAAQLAEGIRRAGGTFDEVLTGDHQRALCERALSVLTNSSPELAPVRADAIQLIGHCPVAIARPALVGTLEGNRTPAEQRATVEGLLRMQDRSVVEELWAHWSRLAPETREGAIDLLLRLQWGASALLDALQEKRIAPRDLSATRIATLRNHADPRLRARALELFGEPAPDRSKAVVATIAALDLPGDARRGHLVYQLQCASCHRLGGEGHALGPDMESVRSQPPEKLLLAIIDPNREVAPTYFATMVETSDDELLTGIVLSETSTSVRLRMASGVELVLSRDQIRSLASEGRSLMPEGFETTLTLQDLADLLSCIGE
jgi:putative heme-binding domain-containing protein